ncbi:MAG: Grx4 family monothiol glutaredoxin [Algiphilus sp.]
MSEASTHERIDALVRSDDVVLFMKGTRDFPQCGFSAVVVKALKLLDQPFTEINVLEDPDIREGVKTYANWQTIPQLYVRGEFVGGCDIVREMYESGELQTLLAQKEGSAQS